MRSSNTVGLGVGLAVVALVAILGGCEGAIYVAHVAEGHFGTLDAVEPIDDVLASDRLSADEEAKLELIVAARQYAVETIGLNAGNSYTTFFDAGDEALAFNLSAARKDALKPYIWRFPIVGDVPYLAFFDEGYRDAVQQQMVDDGYDTHTYEIDAYSTLGVFDDPVRSPMLQRSEQSLAETIIHELLHNTIWRPNHTTFNESLANFVGRKGASEFLNVEFGEDSPYVQANEEYQADLSVVNTFLISLQRDLEAYYAQPLSSAEKIAGREAVYQAARDRFVSEVQPQLNNPGSFGWYANLPTNNAWLLANYRYNYEPPTTDPTDEDPKVFESVFDAVAGDWAAALNVYRAAAEAPGDPFEYLQNWLAEQDN